MNPDNVKEIIKAKYTEIAQSSQNKGCGCGCGPSVSDEIVDFSENYTHLEGYLAEANLGLGCGLPTELAQIKPGDTVLDLGAGAGNDCFVARALVGEAGKVIGVDFSEAMVAKARQNAAKLGFENVVFHVGEIENLPLPDACADVVVSNCVLNLVPDKVRAFAETYRVMKPGGHFSVSDMVVKSQLPEGLRQDASQFAGCVATAIELEEYLAYIQAAGFVNIQIQKSRKLDLPDEMLARYFQADEMVLFKSEEKGLFSINVFAEKPTSAH
ncbi:MAG: arsenite methyltransferase [Microscillaceae bacterium]